MLARICSGNYGLPLYYSNIKRPGQIQLTMVLLIELSYEQI